MQCRRRQQEVDVAHAPVAVVRHAAVGVRVALCRGVHHVSRAGRGDVQVLLPVTRAQLTRPLDHRLDHLTAASIPTPLLVTALHVHGRAGLDQTPAQEQQQQQPEHTSSIGIIAPCHVTAIASTARQDRAHSRGCTSCFQSTRETSRQRRSTVLVLSYGQS